MLDIGPQSAGRPHGCQRVEKRRRLGPGEAEEGADTQRSRTSRRDPRGCPRRAGVGGECRRRDRSRLWLPPAARGESVGRRGVFAPAQAVEWPCGQPLTECRGRGRGSRRRAAWGRAAAARAWWARHTTTGPAAASVFSGRSGRDPESGHELPGSAAASPPRPAAESAWRSRAPTLPQPRRESGSAVGDPWPASDPPPRTTLAGTSSRLHGCRTGVGDAAPGARISFWAALPPGNGG